MSIAHVSIYLLGNLQQDAACVFIKCLSCCPPSMYTNAWLVFIWWKLRNQS